MYLRHCEQLAKSGRASRTTLAVMVAAPAGKVMYRRRNLQVYGQQQTNGAALDIHFFLRQRTAFIRRHYDVCVAAFDERKRLIEGAEPPFDDPRYSEDGEPAFLEEWFDADASIQLVGISCVSLLSDALKLYLNLLVHRQLRFVFTEQEAKRLKKQFVATYRDALGEIYAIDWANTGIDFAVIEQVMLARNRGQHGTHLTSFLLTHDDRTLASHPVPFFISAEESQSLDGPGATLGGFLNPTIAITRDTLFAAIGEVEKLGDWIEANGERALPWLEAQRAARTEARADADDPAGWPRLLPGFATYLAEAAQRADGLRLDEPRLQISIELSRLGDDEYRQSLLSRASAWRAGSGRSTIYVFSYDDPVPQELVSTLRNAADGSLRGIDEARSFPKCNACGESRCLYVGHSFKAETRLRDHLGFGAPGTSSLHLSYWDGHPHHSITFTAYRLPSHDKLLAQLLEEYLWYELKPLLGKRGGR
ncbi:hypothetical protein EAH79_11500 [Sphingomonas koreensis]|nr:hypothetical protein EAH79_11500 [Sphingomonas koreensis]